MLFFTARATVGAGGHVLFIRAFCQPRELVDAFVDHIPETIGQMIPVSAMNLHAFKAVSMVWTSLLARAIVFSTSDDFINPFPLQSQAFRHLPGKRQFKGSSLGAVSVDFHVLPSCIDAGKFTMS